MTKTTCSKCGREIETILSPAPKNIVCTYCFLLPELERWLKNSKEMEVVGEIRE